jgi:hypothetical protein
MSKKYIFIAVSILVLVLVSGILFMNSTVDGQGFLTTQNGDVKTCSGKLVVLMPSTNQNVALVKKWTSVSAILLGMGTNIKEGLNLGITETPEDYARANPNLKLFAIVPGIFRSR